MAVVGGVALAGFLAPLGGREGRKKRVAIGHGGVHFGEVHHGGAGQGLPVNFAAADNSDFVAPRLGGGQDQGLGQRVRH